MKTLRDWAAVALAGLAGAAAGAQPGSAPCPLDAPWQQVLQAEGPGLPKDASAHWLAPGWLHWPGVQAGAGQRFVLAHSASGRLALRHPATQGADTHPAPQGADTHPALQGADTRLPLAPQGALPPPALAAAHRWLGTGTALALPATALPRVPALLRGQLLLLLEDAQGRVLRATQLQLPGVIDTLYARDATGPEPGVALGRGGARFGLWAPTAQAVSLCLEGAAAPLPLRHRAGSGLWQRQVNGPLHGRHYTYLVEVQMRGVGRVRQRVTDPYAWSLDHDSRRAVVLDMAHPSTQPPGWADARRPAPLAQATDQVVYELHVRDFSAHDATVPESQRGKYAAFTQPGSDGMRHLAALAQAGLTHVHLLPVFDFASVPDAPGPTPLPEGPPDGLAQQAAVAATKDRDAYNWGYDPLHFGAPEGSYSSAPADGAVRVREFRAMVQALHGLGLGVGMDVVYNHMSASGAHEKAVLDRIVPGYYHRLNAKGEVENSTCCANTATEHRMMARLMVDTAVRWVRHYRVDAFRFDLMGHQPREAMERLQRAVDAAAGRRVHLLGEGWNFGEVAHGARFVQASQLSLQGSGIATFSDRARDAVRGGGAGDAGPALLLRQGWVSGLHHAPNEAVQAAGQVPPREALLHAADLVRAGLAGTLASYPLLRADGRTLPLSELRYGDQGAGYAQEPGEVVNYVENHDNQTLFDNHVLKLPQATTKEDRARVQTLASAVVLFSQGLAYVHAGQELLRSKSLDRNSYDSGDAFNRLDFSARSNHFGTGAPPAWDNEASWPQMRPLLAAREAIAPAPEHITFARDSFLDLLRIRASSTLFRLPTAAAVRERLRFPGSGPAQSGTLVVGQLNGQGWPGAGFAEVLYFINVAQDEAVFEDRAFASPAYRLHPVHAQGADARARQARHEPGTGRFHIPARTAVVFVRPSVQP